MKTIVVIPTFNEIENIEKLIIAIKSNLPDTDILIVDDNSPDGTSQKVKEMMGSDPKLHVIVRMKKMGLGTAYCEGFQWALENGFEYIMQMDADFSHDPADLPRLLNEIKKYDLVIGSRYVSGVNVVNWPLRRLILSYGANVYSEIITGMRLHDATGGFKCFRASYLKYINLKEIKTNGYGFQIEMNYRMWKLGARIKEMSIIFIDRRSGVSKMNKKIIWEAMWLVWKLRFDIKLHKEYKKLKASIEK
ncbi:MAG: dolichyl-phosphate beta-D-mannosyltransferase [Ignavibacteria bacterium GWF2_33_9]|nr:MAG: dolichyl-phosphate beta-D-mannosyltransferase [Ignavibacteria bacterium GWF2_33_9]